MSVTMGLKLNDDLRQRLKAAAERVGRSPHYVAKHGLLDVLDRIEAGAGLSHPAGPDPEPGADIAPSPGQSVPFLCFAQSVQPQSPLRARITAARNAPEPECLPYLIARARPDASAAPAEAAATAALSRKLVEALRRKGRPGGAEGLLDEYALSSQEGIALMCLAEALLRIPDAATRDALIRDKIAAGDWQAHLGHSPSMFVNAATWGLVVTGKLTATTSEAGLNRAINRVIAQGGEPLIRRAVAMAMRLMGEQFVTGQTIAEALANARRAEARGFRYSYDMLGEAATTMADADRYYAEYERAIHAIGRAAARRGIYEGPGISIKLSALHPRYSRAQIERVMGELLPRLTNLARLARSYDIGLNIDAEEADRLEISLDLLQALCANPDLAGWNGVGFVVQAYGKRCPFVIDWLVDLARRTRRRIMVRLVKGAYWDSEIKRAQIDGLDGFPVFTRKLHTDVSYLACARMLLAAPDAIYPQFATHNAHTLAAIHSMAGANYYPGQYEFQCLHGMGEPLYDEVVGAQKLNRPCRIYAPVGTHETLLAYLVRRLLENGANTSFVNRVADPAIAVEALLADPIAEAERLEPVGAPHPGIAQPRDLFGAARANSAGIDLTSEQQLASLSAAMLAGADAALRAVPLTASPPPATLAARPVRNPADRRDRIGTVAEADAALIGPAMRDAQAGAAIWGGTPAGDRAACLLRAADLMEERMQSLVGLLVREAGKTMAASIAEIREAVDFLRYDAAALAAGFDEQGHRPLGPVLCISPWNFPLAIFTGQVAAALAAGNSVIAKPAEQTPLIAFQATRILHESGIPPEALQLLPGDGALGAVLVADGRLRGCAFTGSTEVARSIARSLASRLTPQGRLLPLIAETGGQNAMIVDSSALAEQVVGDAIASAFDSAGQRCSALRILCLQEDVADRVLAMLKGAMAELVVGPPDRLETDVGPVIDEEALAAIEAHVAAMQAKGHAVHRAALPQTTAQGLFAAPTLIEIASVADVEREVFGPVLHVLRYRRDGLDRLIDQIGATGYGLTFGLHTRIDETIARVAGRVRAGNIYVNRNIVGAVVGVQPFGGEGLSGTGPKAGGPLYLHRLSQGGDSPLPPGDGRAAGLLGQLAGLTPDPDLAARIQAMAATSSLGLMVDLPGPVGERNTYALHPLGTVLCLAESQSGALLQLAACLATGNRARLPAGHKLGEAAASWPGELRDRIETGGVGEPDAILFEGDGDRLLRLAEQQAGREGSIARLQAIRSDALRDGSEAYRLEWLLREQTVSLNTAAAGGNASLMTIG